MSGSLPQPKWRGNPGSEEARAAGCVCAVIDNHYGEGFPRGNGERGWWISGECKLHAKPRKEER